MWHKYKEKKDRNHFAWKKEFLYVKKVHSQALKCIMQ